MTFAVFLLAISPVFANFLGFLAGQRGDRVLREKLADFYVSIQGDWTNIYGRPASLTSSYLRYAFGRRPILFPLLIAVYSLITTSLLTMAHLLLTIPEGVDSAGAILTGQGHFDWPQFWSLYLAPNLVGDLISWSISLFLFVQLAKARPLGAAVLSGCIVFVSAASFVLVARLQAWDWDFLSVPNSLPPLYPPFGDDGGFDSTEWIRLSSALHELGASTDRFTFDYWGAVPLAVFLPALVLGATTIVGLLLIVAKPLLYKPLMLIAERLDASSKSLFNAISATLIGIAVIVTATRTFLATIT